jgi:hypothetical protein
MNKTDMTSKIDKTKKTDKQDEQDRQDRQDEQDTQDRRDEQDRQDEQEEQDDTQPYAVDKVLSKWKSQVFVHMRLQSLAHYHHTRTYNWLSYLTILFSGVTTASVIGSDSLGARYSSAILSMLIIVLTSLIRHIRPSECAQKHAESAQRFETLLQSMHSFKSLPSNLRAEDADFIEQMKSTLDELITSQLDVPSHVITAYEKKFGPIDGILYGDDVICVVANNLRTQHMLRAMHHRVQTSPLTRTPPIDAPSGGLLDAQTTRRIDALLASTRDPV